MKETSSGSEKPTDASVATGVAVHGPAGAARGGGELPPGTLVGEYRVEQELGRGGMGTVYAARHPVIGKRVAIKVLAQQLGDDPVLVRRFVDEARAVNKIGHPNIIDIFAFGQLGPTDHPRQYFVMEYLEGETLAARLARSPPLPGDEACRLLVQTASALEAAHRERIIHRDLKPENLWIAQPKHGDSFIKVLDFGIAKLLELTGGRPITATGTVIGTPHFMAPEQCLGQAVDHRADLYALGVVLYQVFAGKLPFEGRTFAEIVAQQVTVPPRRPSQHRELPAALDDLIIACLEKDPANRPQSAAEVARRLQNALSPGTGQGAATGRLASAAPAVTRAPTASRGGRRLLAWMVVLGAAAALAALISWSANRNRQPGTASPAVPAPPAAPAASASPAPPAPAPRGSGPPPPRTRTAGAPATESAKRPASAPSRVDQQGLIRENPFRP